MSEKVSKTLEYLELHLASSFAEAVGLELRRLSDMDVNTLFLMTHTPGHCGEHTGAWTAVLKPLIEAEQQLRCDIQAIPSIGPVIAPELYRKGGGHYVPL